LAITSPDKIVMRQPSALIPYAKNSRTHSDQQIAQIACRPSASVARSGVQVRRPQILAAIFESDPP
jgi:hypothetical protein